MELATKFTPARLTNATNICFKHSCLLVGAGSARRQAQAPLCTSTKNSNIWQDKTTGF